MHGRPCRYPEEITPGVSSGLRRSHAAQAPRSVHLSGRSLLYGILPRRTIQSCGASSRLHLPCQWLRGDTRESVRILNNGLPTRNAPAIAGLRTYAPGTTVGDVN